jgi:hypothetical protein
MGAFRTPINGPQGRPFQLTLNTPPTPILPGGGDVVALSFAGSETPDPASGDGAFFTPAENMPDSQRVRSLAKIMLVSKTISCPPDETHRTESRGFALFKSPYMDQASPAAIAGGDHHEKLF